MSGGDRMNGNGGRNGEKREGAARIAAVLIAWLLLVLSVLAGARM